MLSKIHLRASIYVHTLTLVNALNSNRSGFLFSVFFFARISSAWLMHVSYRHLILLPFLAHSSCSHLLTLVVICLSWTIDWTSIACHLLRTLCVFIFCSKHIFFSCRQTKKANLISFQHEISASQYKLIHDDIWHFYNDTNTKVSI